MSSVWLSYSSYKLYKDCPEHYYRRKVKKMDPPVEESKHNALVGTVVQKVYEDFYNDEIWRKGAETSEELLKRADLYFWQFIETNHMDYSSFSCRYDNANDAWEEVMAMVPKVLQTIKRERLLGPYAKSEVSLKVRFGAYDFLLGYLDFVIKSDSGEVMILDGKASRHREKYVDETQLYFYALMYYYRYKRLPDKLGFFFYHFGDDPEKAMMWLPVDKAKIRDLAQDIHLVMQDIRTRQFGATPSTNSCRFCTYQSICPSRLGMKKANREKRAKSKPQVKVNVVKDNKIGF